MTGSMVAAQLLAELIVQGESEYEALFSSRRSMLTQQLLTNTGAAAKGLLSFGGPRCTHMGCKLHKNHAEQTWDCHCHGSRYDAQGHVIDGPGKKGL